LTVPRAIEDMRYLTEKYGEGYQGPEPRKTEEGVGVDEKPPAVGTDEQLAMAELSIEDRTLDEAPGKMNETPLVATVQT
jgi:hypothetical protein